MNSAARTGSRSSCAAMISGCGSPPREARSLQANRDVRPVPPPDQFLHSRKSATYVPLRAHSHYSFLDSTLSPARHRESGQAARHVQPWR